MVGRGPSPGTPVMYQRYTVHERDVVFQVNYFLFFCDLCCVDCFIPSIPREVLPSFLVRTRGRIRVTKKELVDKELLRG